MVQAQLRAGWLLVEKCAFEGDAVELFASVREHKARSSSGRGKKTRNLGTNIPGSAEVRVFLLPLTSPAFYPLNLSASDGLAISETLASPVVQLTELFTATISVPWRHWHPIQIFVSTTNCLARR